MGPKLEALTEHLTRVIDLRRATGVLDWDQEVNMPEGGAEPRSHAQATLTSMAHEIFNLGHDSRVAQKRLRRSLRPGQRQRRGQHCAPSRAGSLTTDEDPHHRS